MSNLLTSDEPEGEIVTVRHKVTGELQDGVVTEGGIVRSPNESQEHRPAFSAGMYEVTGS